jgi:hypothetical protein
MDRTEIPAEGFPGALHRRWHKGSVFSAKQVCRSENEADFSGIQRILLSLFGFNPVADAAQPRVCPIFRL